MVSHRYNRKKGHDFEREIAKRLRDIGFRRAKRHLEVQREEANGFDLDHTGPFAIQCKRTKKYASIETINEIKSDLMPILVTKGNGKPIMVAMTFDDWLKLAEKFNDSLDRY